MRVILLTPSSLILYVQGEGRMFDLGDCDGWTACARRRVEARMLSPRHPMVISPAPHTIVCSFSWPPQTENLEGHTPNIVTE